MASICFVFHFSLTRELAQQLLSLVAFLLRDILGRELHVCLAIWWTLFVGGSMRLDISKFQRSKKVVRAIFSISEVMAYFNNVVFFFSLSIMLVQHINVHILPQLFCRGKLWLFFITIIWAQFFFLPLNLSYRTVVIKCVFMCY